MKMADALATATANGWQDESHFTRHTIAEQVSRVTDGFLATVSILTDGGGVVWNVCDLHGSERSQRGTAKNADAAFAACETSIAAITGTLF